MNLSGNGILPLFSYYGFTPEQLIVVFDDLDLPLGTHRIKKGGGSGGHNGIKSVIGCVGADFIRIRIGIGKPEEKRENDVLSHVLGRFSSTEEKIFNEVTKKAEDAVTSIVKNGLEKTMEFYNRKDTQLK
jgi:PTH1 family peptidyl-tRNA hydrolase